MAGWGVMTEELNPPFVVMNIHEHSSISSDPNDHKMGISPTDQLPEEVPHAPVVDPDVERNPGVARVEALHRHLGGIWIWTLYISIGALAYIYSLDQNPTSNYLPLATSSFGQHAFLGTISTAEGIISAPFPFARSHTLAYDCLSRGWKAMYC
jgi:hypothetical protein